MRIRKKKEPALAVTSTATRESRCARVPIALEGPRKRRTFGAQRKKKRWAAERNKGPWSLGGGKEEELVATNHSRREGKRAVSGGKG